MIVSLARDGPIAYLEKGGYVFVRYESDHPPRHLHLLKDGRVLDHFELEHRGFVYGTIARHRGRVLKAMRAVGSID